MIKCTFSDVSERDMDLLFLEEFICSEEFLNIFLSRIGLVGATVCEIEQSKVDVELGESDITVIVQKNDKKYGLLIEDKIDAKAQENQSGRYIKRGEKGKEKGDYEEFFVFIVAPKEYLSVNKEAQKYGIHISYEECLEYFKAKADTRCEFKAQQIEQAINKQKHGYQVIENSAVTRFWREYIEYQKEHYPELILRDKGDVKGSKATWVTFHTSNPKIKIYHKSEKGCVDLEFAGLGNKLAELKSLIISSVGKLWDNGMDVWKTDKSAVLRVRVPEIDFRSDFEQNRGKVDEALKEAKRLYSILDDIPLEKLNELFSI